MESLQHVRALELQLQVRGGGAGMGRERAGGSGSRAGQTLPFPTCPARSPVARVTSRGPSSC